MYASSERSHSGSSRGPALYFGYCRQTRRFRMMDLPDYMSNMQEGMSQFVSDTTSMVNDMARRYGMTMPGQTSGGGATHASRDCHCDDCHCECCVCDADVLVHARCSELRRIPVTFENDTRRERPVKLTLEKFVSAGGRDLGWKAELSETEFTLRGCGEHTVVVTVRVICEAFQRAKHAEALAERIREEKPLAAKAPKSELANEARQADEERHLASEWRDITLDRCEVGYGTLRAEGCIVRPIVLAIAVLPDDCDSYRRPCGCDCCCR